jgi:hypothetical protein
VSFCGGTHDTFDRRGLLKLAALLGWFGQEKELAATCRRGRTGWRRDTRRSRRRKFRNEGRQASLVVAPCASPESVPGWRSIQGSNRLRALPAWPLPGRGLPRPVQAMDGG